MAYSVKTGVWKSIKNTLVVMLPAMGAGWLAFTQNIPVEYQPFVVLLGGFFAYLVKNYIGNR